jgi:dipeptidyl aminopeptidase/acylaminoacyl peptidase
MTAQSLLSVVSRLSLRGVGFILLCFCASGQQPAKAGFTLRQVMSAPFTSDLTAAPAHDAFAWVANVEGRRNLWVAVRSGTGYVSRQITGYDADDGQEVGSLVWSPDAKALLYVRGGSSDFPEGMAPNPAHLLGGAERDVWVVGLDGSAPRKVAEGRSPTFSPDGNFITWFADGQIWYEKAGDIGGKPAEGVHVYGDCSAFTWSPDSSKLAFVSDRDGHSFIGVFALAANALTFVDPGTDHDLSPVWSADSREIAFVRVPYFKDENYSGPQRTGEPWSIRVADATTGQGHEVWKAEEGSGSVLRPLDANSQLFWTADDHLIFPWEHDGWNHFYAIPSQGGPAKLLTPGDFELENAGISGDRKFVVFSSNQGDSERRHVWKVSATSDAPVALTEGTGIETHPAVGSDSRTVAVLRSDAQIPLRPAIVGEGSQMHDLAPQAIPADFPAGQLVAPQPVVYASTDGMQIHGDLFLPAGSGTCVRHPALVFVHGGSQRQMFLGWHNRGYYSNAYALNEYFASRGYVVLAINYRSGIGYGLNFREALKYGATGASEFQDVVGAGQYLRSRCDVQPEHIGIWGGSWGGFLTAMALARASDLFAAGVDMSGVHDWNIDQPGNFRISDTATDINARWRLAWESSPLASVKTWRSPVLLIQGDNDDEVPFNQTMQLAAALRQQRVVFQELIFPDEVHDFLLDRNWYAAYSATVSFFEQHLGPGKP